MPSVFLTGATGFVGTAVTKDLITHGYTVVGLARSEASAQKLRDLGAEVHYGSLDDHASLTAGAKAADAVIHAAFIHDWLNLDHSMERNCQVDLESLKALVEGVRGTNKVIINTNGLLGGVPGKVHTESDDKVDGPPRKVSETYFKEIATTEGIRAITIRLPPSVHGKGDVNFIPALIAGAKRNGYSMYVADGSSRWPTVNVNDAAVIYRLALEKNLPAGQFLHPFAEQPTTKDIAETIAKKVGVPTKSVDQATAESQFGFIGYALATDGFSSKDDTVRLTGWVPKDIGLLVDITQNYPA